MNGCASSCDRKRSSRGEPPRILQATATPTRFDVGETTTIAILWSRGTAPVHYLYSGLPPPCASADVEQLSCTPYLAGTFPVRVGVLDSSGDASTAIVQVQVLPVLANLSLLPEPPEVELGQSVTFHARLSGGLPPMLYDYSGPGDCRGSGGSNFACTPNTTGLFLENLTVIDSTGADVRASSWVEVFLPVQLENVDVSPPTIDNGSTVQINGVVVGGAPPFAYAVVGLPRGCPSPPTSFVIICRPIEEGTFNVTMEVTDARGRVSQATARLTVAAGLSVAVSGPFPGNPVRGYEFSVLATPAGGVGPYRYL
jgi:hypothetical protein